MMIKLVSLIGTFLLLLTASKADARKFWYPVSTSAQVTVANSSEWEAAGGAGYYLQHTKGSSSITAGSTRTLAEDNPTWDEMDRQYVSNTMQAGVTFPTSDTIKSYLMTREFGNTDDVLYCMINARVVSQDGTTVRQTLKAVNGGSSAEFINNATMRNKQCGSTAVLDAGYTTVDGDRLVIEIGYRADDANSSPQAAAKWGENATDCAENETNTTNCAGWVEISTTILMTGESARRRVMQTGFLDVIRTWFSPREALAEFVQ